FASYGSADDLWVASTSTTQMQLVRVTSGQVRPRQIQWSKRGGGMVYFLDGTGQNCRRRPGGRRLGSPPGPPSVGGGGAAGTICGWPAHRRPRCNWCESRRGRFGRGKSSGRSGAGR